MRLKHRPGNIFIACILFFFLIFSGSPTAVAQFTQQPIQPGAPGALINAPLKDSSNKTNTNKWRDEDAKISFRKAGSKKVYVPDSSLLSFHRRAFVQPWYRDLGNSGSAARNLYFTPQAVTGPTLGYHAFDIYRYKTDSLLYYNTNRPYTSFTYQLGSKLEQMAHVLHTQNIKPNWNVAAQYRKTTSPGYYKIQRINHDNAALSTNYQSLNQHYELFGAIVYNKEQQDENGGIVSDSFLSLGLYSNRQTIPVGFDNDFYSTRRSSVTTTMRDFAISLQHSFTWGRTDTLYNEDSTRYSFHLRPRFSISHGLQISSEKYQYKDIRPDSLRYIELFTGQAIPQNDSVYMRQQWLKVENRLGLNGFLGKEDRQLQFTLGAGNRIDKFTTYAPQQADKNSFVSNYLYGTIRKEALQAGQWSYEADAQFFLTGDAAGNFILNASLGKDLGGNLGGLTIGFRQQLNNAPYAYTVHQTAFDNIRTGFSKETITQVYGTIYSPKLKLWATVSNYLIDNYIYINENLRPAQYSTAFNITQASLSKNFRLGIVVLANELAWQQVTGNAPLNLPALMGRHQLGIETYLFKNALKVSTGVQVTYHTPYHADGYSPFFNRFYYQNSYQVSNDPETAVFFDFKIKRFRAYIMGDQLNQLYGKNIITAPGYAAQNAMLRFGFNWIMIN